VLLFSVQPMFARMVVPLLGGSPGVWNTALVFYQAALLAGYGYAHVSTKLLGVRGQAKFHVALLAVGILGLPIGVPAGWIPPADADPVGWLLMLLTVGVGLPFVLVSSTAPLVQRWFATSAHRAARDPYVLYAASNAGSLLALLAYPFVIEPMLPVAAQTKGWSAGYIVLALLMVACGAVVVRRSVPGVPERPSASVSTSARVPLEPLRRGKWIMLALVPSSLMLGVTTHLSSEVASIPLLWVVPLAIYLLTFVLTFSPRPPSRRLMLRLLPLVVLVLTVILAWTITRPLPLIVAVDLMVLFIGAMVCHGELARDRPSPEHLTEFYFWVALGGVIGGAFNALVAPVIFTRIVEYPIMVLLLILLAPLEELRRGDVRAELPAVAVVPPARPALRFSSLRRDHVLDVVLPALLALMTVGTIVLGPQVDAWLGRAANVLLVLPPLIAFQFSRRRLRFALAVAAVVLAGSMADIGRVLHTERSFFGVHRVVIDTTGSYHDLMHGSTLHGRQSRDPALSREALGYYTATGPAGDILATIPRPSRVAVVGLGVGTLSAHAVAGDRWTFYEIDPAVERIARNPRFFTYLADSAGQVRVVLGDARLNLAATFERYDLVILDAYTSDAIPIHLLTREAVQLYFARISPRGLVALHVSSRHFSLGPVVSAISRDLGLVGHLRQGRQDAEGLRRSHWSSEWAVLARDADHLGALPRDSRWIPLDAVPASRTWTDDYSSILTVLRSDVLPWKVRLSAAPSPRDVRSGD
jgi:spermidine synthase